MAGAPPVVRLDGADGVSVRAVIPHVRFRCRVSGRVSTYDIAVEWRVAGGRSLEFYGLREWVEAVAAERDWAVEELVAELARRLGAALGAPVRVEAYGLEGSMPVTVRSP